MTEGSTLEKVPGALDDIAVRRWIDAAGDPDWVGELRRSALQIYQDGGLPDRALHLWRYTDPARLLPGSSVPDSSVPDSSVPDGRGAPVSQATTTTIEAQGELPEGVIACGLQSALELHRPLVERWLGQMAPSAESRWTALNQALWCGGTFVYVPRNVAVEAPIRVLSTLAAGAGTYHPRLLVVLERGASLSLVDEQTDGAEAVDRCLVNAVTEFALGAGARLRYAQVQRYGTHVHHSLVQRALLETDASLDSVTIALGARLSKVDVGASLRGRGAAAEILGVVFGDGRQHFDHHTVLDHEAERTTSNLDFRVALANRASSAYTGLLRIREGGKKSEASQLNRNLLLSDNARADSIPELEILTDDVRASHGVAVGPIDPMQVFFCQSRGLSRRDAVNMIVGGFFEPIIARVPDEDLRARLRNHIDEKLASIDVDSLPLAPAAAD